MPVTEHVADVFIELNGVNLDPKILRDKLMWLEVDTSLYLPDMFTMQFRDYGLELLERDLFKPGTMVTIYFRPPAEERNTNPTKIKVIEGEITSLEPVFGGESRTVITVYGYDLSHRMNRVRKTQTFLNQSDSDIVRKLAAEAGLQAQVTGTSPVYPYIIQSNQTNWEFAMERAQRIGYRLHADGRVLRFEPPPPAPPETEVRWGIDITEFRARLSTVEQLSQVTVYGWDPKTKRTIIGQATTPSNTPRIRKDNGAVGGARAKQAHGSEGKQVVVGLPVYNQQEAQNVAQAILDRSASGFVEAEGMLGPFPSVRAGTIVNVTGVGSRFSGKYLVTRALHRYRADEYSVRFWASGGNGMMTITDLLKAGAGSNGASVTGITGRSAGRPAFNGVMVGVVTDNNDPEGMGRVKVQFPTLGNPPVESFWCRMASFEAGAGKGVAHLPEVGDEVVVAFQNGDPNFPYVIGCVWNGTEKPPRSDASSGPLVQGGKTIRRVTKTRVGHEITFVDSPASPEGIFIMDKTQNNFIKIISTGNKLQIQCQGDIEVTSVQGNITIKASTGKVTVQAMQDLELKSDTGKVKISGSTGVEINTPMKVSVSGAAGVDVKGAMINLN
jgi:phage protein D/phage baseplate assembly protein gpV